MATYFAPYRVLEGPTASGNFRCYEQNTNKTVGEAPTREAVEKLARALNQAYTDLVNDGGWVSY